MSPEQDVKLDLRRSERTGLDEAILCSGKRVEHLVHILDRAQAEGASLLLTRLSPEQLAVLPQAHRTSIDYEPASRTAFFGQPHPMSANDPRVAVVAAGTSDVFVSRESVRTLNYYGVACLEISDVGVAGLWRLLERVEELRRMRVVIAVAGMDAALPTVLGGLIGSVLIGVPTSVGPGVAAGGETALRAMLASCASGLLVSNIDNGYGAACAAIRMLKSFA